MMIPGINNYYKTYIDNLLQSHKTGDTDKTVLIPAKKASGTDPTDPQR